MKLALQAQIALAELPAHLSSGNETPNGPGSSIDATKDIRNNLPKIFEKFNIKSMIDAPCGDWNWMQKIKLKDVKYYGYDIMPEYINDNKERFENNNVKFEVKDVVEEDLGVSVDLIMCRDFVMHLKWDKVKETILNFKKSKSKYLLITNFSNHESHSDNFHIETHPSAVNLEIKDYNGVTPWGWKPTNLILEPFNFPKPIYEFVENHENCGGRSMCLWNLEDIKL